MFSFLIIMRLSLLIDRNCLEFPLNINITITLLVVPQGGQKFGTAGS